MKINEISEMLKQDIDYYKCILINGSWGIGKTYEINKIKNEKKLKNKIVITTLFGKSSIGEIKNEIYHETNGKLVYVFFVFAILIFSLLQVLPITIKNISPFEAFENIKDGVSIITWIYYVVKIVTFVSALLFGFFITKENFGKVFLKIKKTNKNTIIVFDDFERMSPIIKIIELLGFIEELKNSGYIVIVISDETKIKDKKQYNDFKEKVIDKTYNILENEQDTIGVLVFKGIEIDEDIRNSTLNFIEKHKIINLRTMQRANKFIRQIINNIEIKDNNIKIDIILSCLAICSENSDNLYFSREKENYEKLQEEKMKEANTDNFSLDIKIDETKKCIDNVNYRIINCYDLEKDLVEWLYAIFIGKNKLDNKELFNSYLINRRSIDPFDVLNNDWFEAEDVDIISNMNKILNNLEICKYDISEYPKIVSLFIKIKNMGFDSIYLEKCIAKMEENINKSNSLISVFDSFGTNLYDDKDITEYKKIITDLEKKLVDKYEYNVKTKINSIINKEDGWGLLFHEYCSKNNFLNRKKFMKLIDVDNLVEVVNFSKTKDIRDFGKQINSIYGLQNIKEYYTDDIENLQKIYEKLVDMDISKYSISKNYSIKFLSDSIDKIIKKLI